ncbi:hypothetical protein ACFWY9_27255 [Amycolatopsis sp. NPDC059027]|uniref:hypothetical protein n=1 Tax=Amycolatopsis sp. NPDC059027 TaxID=3346709 RepID=UPI00366FF1C2
MDRAAVMNAYSRLIIGWSIVDHMRTELVTDALGMAILRREGPLHSKAPLPELTPPGLTTLGNRRECSVPERQG